MSLSTTARLRAKNRARERTAQYGPLVLLSLAIFAYAQPSILGEGRLSTALALSAVTAALALLVDVSRARWLRSSAALILMLSASAVWVLLTTSGYGVEPGPIILGTVSLLLALGAVALVFSDRRRALGFARVLLIVVALLSGSSIVTAALSAVGASVALFTFPVNPTIFATVHFPFTPTISTQSVFGVNLPRFAGVGREAGWMAMFAAAAFFLWPLAFRGSPVLTFLRLLLIGGVLTPISTAGFGVFVVVAAIAFLLSPGATTIGAKASRWLVGAVAVGFAVWVALYAPVVGLEAKANQNALSLNERNAVTQAGIDALTNLSLGEPSEARVANINILASAAENGWPYVVLMTLALLLPLAFTNWRRAAPPVLVVFLSLLLSQPPGGSIGAYIIVVLACALADDRAKNVVRSDE